MITDEIQPDIAIIDADSIIYQIAFVNDDVDKCCKQLDNKIKEIMNNTEAASAVVYVKGRGNFRNEDADYKANRKDMVPPDVKERIELIYEYSHEFAMQCDNGEADDYCAITAEMAIGENKQAIVCHIDKDLRCIPGWHYDYRKNEFFHMIPEAAYGFMMRQLITGDATDGVKGLYKIGPVKANKHLMNVPVEDQLQHVFKLWEDRNGAEWKALFSKCANGIYLRTKMDDLRMLSFDELKERLSWKPPKKIMATGLPSPQDPPEHSDSYMQFSDQLAECTSEESN